jgi:hypothetical protein
MLGIKFLKRKAEMQWNIKTFARFTILAGGDIIFSFVSNFPLQSYPQMLKVYVKYSVYVYSWKTENPN